MPIYNNHKKDQDELWSTVSWRKEYPGICTKCKVGKRCLWTIYANGDELVRCLNCKVVGEFLIDITAFNDPSLYPPFKSEDEMKEIKSAWDSRHSKGLRW